jgi:hypothetical protein
MLARLTRLTGIGLGNYASGFGEPPEVAADDDGEEEYEEGVWVHARLPRLEGLSQLTELRVEQTSQLPLDWRRLSSLEVLRVTHWGSFTSKPLADAGSGKGLTALSRLELFYDPRQQDPEQPKPGHVCCCSSA